VDHFYPACNDFGLRTNLLGHKTYLTSAMICFNNYMLEVGPKLTYLKTTNSDDQFFSVEMTRRIRKAATRNSSPGIIPLS